MKGGGGIEGGVKYTSSPLLNDALFKYPVQQKDI